MEQKDYLLREIEKVGAIMRAIRQKIFGGRDNVAIRLEQHINEEKERLLDEMNFDLSRFLSIKEKESNNYILSIAGFNVDNLTLLADNLFEIGCSEQCEDCRMFLEKSLQLYELCCSESKTYSIEREAKIMFIKNALETAR